MKKLCLLAVCAVLLGGPAAASASTALEGRISKIDPVKSEIIVCNVLEKGTPGVRERRVRVRPDKIQYFKKSDYVRVELAADQRRAETIELVRR